MVLFVLRTLILQMCMRSHPVELDVWFLVVPFVYFHTSCVRTAKALARLLGCAGSPEPSLVPYVISTKTQFVGIMALDFYIDLKFFICMYYSLFPRILLKSNYDAVMIKDWRLALFLGYLFLRHLMKIKANYIANWYQVTLVFFFFFLLHVMLKTQPCVPVVLEKCMQCYTALSVCLSDI